MQGLITALTDSFGACNAQASQSAAWCLHILAHVDACTWMKQPVSVLHVHVWHVLLPVLTSAAFQAEQQQQIPAVLVTGKEV